MTGRHIVTQRLGRTVDGRIVPYESPEAAFLAYFPGQEISLEEALAAGLFQPFIGDVIGDVLGSPDDAEPGDGAMAAEGDAPEPAGEPGGLQILMLDDQFEVPGEVLESYAGAAEDVQTSDAEPGDGIMAAEETAATKEPDSQKAAEEGGVEIKPQAVRARSNRPRTK